jgi:hypothetical protein
VWVAEAGAAAATGGYTHQENGVSMRSFAWMFGIMTVLIYLLSAWFAYRVTTLQRGVSPWRQLWIWFSLAMLLLSFLRMHTLATVPSMFSVRDVLALVVSLCFLRFVWGMWSLFKGYRLGASIPVTMMPP